MQAAALKPNCCYCHALHIYPPRPVLRLSCRFLCAIIFLHMCVSACFFFPLTVFILALFLARHPRIFLLAASPLLAEFVCFTVFLFLCFFAAAVVLFSLTGVSNLLLIEMFVYLPSNLYSLCGSKGGALYPSSLRCASVLALVSYSFRNSFGRFGWLELIFMPPSAGQQAAASPIPRPI